MKVEKVFEEVNEKVVKMKVYSPDELIQRGFQGVWIPKEIWLAEELSWTEKLFLTEINSLDNDKGCFASNSHFSKFFHMTTGRCSQIITSLLEKGYVHIEYEKEGKQIIKRVIKILKEGIKYSKDPIKNIKAPYLENDKGINTLINNTINNTYYENQYFKITEDEHKKYKEVYKDIDIDLQYKKMEIWINANPERKKKNYKRFINNWLNNTPISKSNLKEKEKDIPLSDPMYRTDDDGLTIYRDRKTKQLYKKINGVRHEFTEL